MNVTKKSALSKAALKKKAKLTSFQRTTSLMREGAKSLLQGPETANLPASQLTKHLACEICGGFLYHATTAVECMHSFCRKCVINRVDRGFINCPVCDLPFHSSNAYLGLREDYVLQDIVYKILPHVQKRDKAEEEEFYKQRNMPLPSQEAMKKKPLKQKNVKRWISIELKHVGCTKEVKEEIGELDNKFLKIPDYATIRDVQKYLKTKLNIDEYIQALFFFDLFLLHEDLTMDEFQLLFLTPEEMAEEEELVLLLHVVFAPKGRDYYNFFPSDRTRDNELDWPCYGEAVEQTQEIVEENITIAHDAEDMRPPRRQSAESTATVNSTRSSASESGKYIKLYLCYLCNKEQTNIYCHLKATHKLSGEERTRIARRCSKRTLLREEYLQSD